MDPGLRAILRAKHQHLVVLADLEVAHDADTGCDNRIEEHRSPAGAQLPYLDDVPYVAEAATQRPGVRVAVGDPLVGAVALGHVAPAAQHAKGPARKVQLPGAA